MTDPITPAALPPQPARTRATGNQRLAYYFPWTLLLLASLYVICYALTEVRTFHPAANGMGYYRPLMLPHYCTEMVILSLTIYIICVLPPLLVYLLLRGVRRKIAYMVHAAWFIVGVAILLSSYRVAGPIGSELVTPNDICSLHFGMKWSGISGAYAADCLIAAGVVGIAYSAEKMIKEKARALIRPT